MVFFPCLYFCFVASMELHLTDGLRAELQPENSSQCAPARVLCCRLAGGTVRYFCTAGRGMERFVANEVKEKLEAEQVECILGKVFFTAKSDVRELRKIKSGERLFLLLKKEPPLTLPNNNRGRGLNEIKKCVVGEPRCWLDALTIWQNLQAEKDEQEAESCATSLKRKSDNCQEVGISKRRKKEYTWEEKAADGSFGDDQTKSIQDNTTCEKMTTLPEEPIARKRQHDFGFRVSCRCSGAVAKRFTAQELGRIIGTTLIKQFGWKAELRNPDLEIFVHLNDEHCVVGFPLLRVPLASRTYIRSAGLRSTIAWAMASVAEISVGAHVLDPMCGLGTILLEAAKEWPDACYLGMDINDSPLQGAYDNVKAAGLMDSIGLLKASATKLPLLPESVDVVISDIPFGKKFVGIKEALLGILREMERVLRVGGTIVLLLSHKLNKQVGEYIAGSHRNDRPMNPASTKTCRAEMMNDCNPQERQTNILNISSSSQESDREICGGQQTCIRSLMPMDSYGVSLGTTEAFIFKCKKISSPPLQ